MKLLASSSALVYDEFYLVYLLNESCRIQRMLTFHFHYIGNSFSPRWKLPFVLSTPERKNLCNLIQSSKFRYVNVIKLSSFSCSVWHTLMRNHRKLPALSSIYCVHNWFMITLEARRTSCNIIHFSGGNWCQSKVYNLRLKIAFHFIITNISSLRSFQCLGI